MPSNIKPGDVIKLYCHAAKPTPKIKRVILIAETTDMFLATFINTEANGNVFDEEVLNDLHIPFEAKGRKYLEYDSHIDCAQPVEISKSDVINAIKDDLDNLLGSLTKTDFNIIRETVYDSYLLAGKIKKKYF